MTYRDVPVQDTLVSCSRPYSRIFRYRVPRLISSMRAASFLFQAAAASARAICARSASRRVGSRSGAWVVEVGIAFACRNSTSLPRITSAREQIARRGRRCSRAHGCFRATDRPGTARSLPPRTSWRRVGARWRHSTEPGNRDASTGMSTGRSRNEGSRIANALTR